MRRSQWGGKPSVSGSVRVVPLLTLAPLCRRVEVPGEAVPALVVVVGALPLRVSVAVPVSFPEPEVCCWMLAAKMAALTALDDAVRRRFNVPSETDVEPSVVRSVGSGRMGNSKCTSSKLFP